MSGGILTILLLIEAASVSGALLKWFPPTIQYKSNKFGLSNGIRYEVQLNFVLLPHRDRF
jgi:hypothetical protein